MANPAAKKYFDHNLCDLAFDTLQITADATKTIAAHEHKVYL